MHTPGHAVINLAVIGRCFDASVAAPILLGAIVPDLPILALYAQQRWLKGTPEDEIWSVHYQKPFWQNVVHSLHSIPVTLAGLILGLALTLPAVAAFFGSMLLHACSDLPIHGKDAHRHFLPFSQYRFISPLSYWDVAHHGRQVAAVELLLVYLASAWLWSGSGIPGRVALAVVCLGYAVNYWRSFVRTLVREPARS